MPFGCFDSQSHVDVAGIPNIPNCQLSSNMNVMNIVLDRFELGFNSQYFYKVFFKDFTWLILP